MRLRISMGDDNNNIRNGGVSFIGLLQIAFIVLKLCGVIDWSWIWVLAPIWGSVVLLVLLVIIVVIIAKTR